MKSFANDEKPIDIEDLDRLKCLQINDFCNNNKNDNDKKVHIIADNNEWFAPQSIDELYALLTEYQFDNYTLVGANTSKGIYKNDGPFNVLINTQKVAELYQLQSTPTSLTVGANVTLSSLIEIFNMTSENSGFEYLSVLSDHISKIAHVSVRNVGTWAGNLGIKNAHTEFPSDIFVIFETVGATLTIKGYDKSSVNVNVADILTINMKGKFIYSINFPPYDKTNTFIKTYKIMPRSQNAHAYVNAGFRLNIDPQSYIVKDNPVIVFGGINSTFVHAIKTEQYLVNRNLSNAEVLQSALKVLQDELQPNDDPVLASVEYRRSLACSLFYKYVLGVCDKFVDSRFKSAKNSVIDDRLLSQGSTEFSNHSEYVSSYSAHD